MGDCLVIGYYRASGPVYALEFGNGSSSRVHGQALAELYPNAITYNLWEKHFLSYTHAILDLDVWRMVQMNKCVLMQGNGRASLPPEFQLRSLAVAGNGRYGNESEVIYKLLSLPRPAIATAQLTHPNPDTVLSSSPVTFAWDPANGVDDYWIDIGTSPAQGNLVATSTSGAPFFTVDLGRYLDGRTIYVQIYSKFAGLPLQPGTGAQYQFKTTAAHQPGNPLLTAPAPGTLLKTSPVTFAWNAVPGAGDYWIDVGTAPAKGNIFGGFTRGATQVTVDLGGYLNGQNVYVQLYSKVAGASMAGGTGSLYRYATAGGN
jgi:hypothetical protein